MIVKAAVKIFDIRQNKEWTIPCMRHCDAFYILKEFGYTKNIDYKELEQGFLDEYDNFYNRIAAKKYAQEFNQLKENTNCAELYSEDLW